MEGQEGGESGYYLPTQHMKSLIMGEKVQGVVNKIELDSREKEKTSFATLSRGHQHSSSTSGINITYSDDREGGGDYSKSRRGSTKEYLLSSGPATPSKSSRGLSPGLLPGLDKGEEDLLGSQLNTVRMRLEERRKRIEVEKQKMELVMAKQREKVGQEAFLRAVAKGIKRAGGGQKEGVETAKTEILELANRVGGERVERRARPFSLHLQSEGLVGGQGSDVKTPDMEALDISRMSDSLYELQSDIQKLAVQQTQIQNMMKQSSPQPSVVRTEQPSSSSQQPFYISHHSSNQPPQQQQPPFFISHPEPPNPALPPQQPQSQSHYPPSQPSHGGWGQTQQPVGYQPSTYDSRQRPMGYDGQPQQFDSQMNPNFTPHPQLVYQRQPPQNFFDHQRLGYEGGQHPVYEGHIPRSQNQYLDQYGRPFRDQWGNPLTVQPPPLNPVNNLPTHHQPQPMYVGYNPALNQTYPPVNQPQYPTHSGYPSSQLSQSFNASPAFNHPPKYSENLDNSHNSNQGSPYHRSSLSRNSSLKRSQSRNSPQRTERISVPMRSLSQPKDDDSSDLGRSYEEVVEPQKVSFVDSSEDKTEPETPRPKVTLVRRREESPCKPPTAEKPSLSTSFLEQKRRNLEHQQQIKHQTKLPTEENSTSGLEDSTIDGNPEEKIQEEMTRSTLETLNSMKTEEIKEKKESKGFVISFDDEAPVKPKPALKPRRSSKKTEELDERTTNSVIINFDNDLETSRHSGGSLKDTLEDRTPDSPADELLMDCSDVTICPICDMNGGEDLICKGKFSLCESCSDFLKTATEQCLVSSENAACLIGSNSCVLGNRNATCPRCFVEKAKKIGLLQLYLAEEHDEKKDVAVNEDSKELLEIEKKKEWVIMMSEKRKQQVEDNRLKREEESRVKREEEEAKRDEVLRKKEEDKKRREDIFQQYKIKKEMEKAKDEGRNFFAATNGPKMRPKSAGGNRPRPRTIHGEKDDLGLNSGRVAMRGSQSNIAIGGVGDGGSFRSSGGRLQAACRRGSNASLQDEADSSMFGGSLRGLGHIGRSKSSSASNLGPGSLPLGIRSRGGRGDFDDNASDVSSTTSGYRSGRGSAKLFREPVSKSNRPIILNAVEYVVFPGVVNKDTRARVLEEIERCDCPHFLILFRDSKLQFRGLYAYYPDTEEVFKIYGTGPRQVTDNMFDRFYKYNSGGKKFTQIHTKHLTVTIDAFTIHNQLWLGKKTKLPDKKDLALVV